VNEFAVRTRLEHDMPITQKRRSTPVNVPVVKVGAAYSKPYAPLADSKS
jgi:hypothetical protein